MQYSFVLLICTSRDNDVIEFFEVTSRQYVLTTAVLVVYFGQGSHCSKCLAPININDCIPFHIQHCEEDLMVGSVPFQCK